MKNLKNKTIFFTAVLFVCVSVILSADNVKAATGCCVKSTNIDNYGTSNCIKNVASATECTKQASGGVFESGDANCDGAGTKKFCNDSILSETKTGCCIKSTKKDNYGTSNCIKNVASATECTKQASGGVFESGEASCDGAGSKEFCTAASDSDASGSSTSVTFTNPLNYTTVEGLLDNVLSSIQKIVVVLGLIVLIIGAVMYIVSVGESETVERAKKAITMAIMGVVIAIAAPSILKEIGTAIGWTDVSSNSTTSSALTLSEIAVKVLDFLLGISGVLSIIMMVIGGIMYLTSAGDEERIKKGKDIFKFSVLGIIIVLASLVIVRQIAKFFVSS